MRLGIIVYFITILKLVVALNTVSNIISKQYNSNEICDTELTEFFVKYNNGCVNCYIPTEFKYGQLRPTFTKNKITQMTALIINSYDFTLDIIDNYIKSNVGELNIVNNDDYTPLMIACMNSHNVDIRAIELLLLNGADPNIEIHMYRNAYELTSSINIKKLLIEYKYQKRTWNYMYTHNFARFIVELFTTIYFSCLCIIWIYIIYFIIHLLCSNQYIFSKYNLHIILTGIGMLYIGIIIFTIYIIHL